MPAPTQPEPAEGAPTDDRERPATGHGQGVSSEAPAEGADDIAAPGDGSPAG